MPTTPWMPGDYPPTSRSDHVDIYNSALKREVHVPDPYQWLEENSDEVDNWTTAQAAFTQAYLDQKADTKRLKDKFRAGMNYAKVITRPLSCISSSCLKPFPVFLCANSTFFESFIVLCGEPYDYRCRPGSMMVCFRFSISNF
jgi:hypothetical protein